MFQMNLQYYPTEVNTHAMISMIRETDHFLLVSKKSDSTLKNTIKFYLYEFYV